jgi:hypothetical protein
MYGSGVKLGTYATGPTVALDYTECKQYFLLEYIHLNRILLDFIGY